LNTPLYDSNKNLQEVILTNKYLCEKKFLHLRKKSIVTSGSQNQNPVGDRAPLWHLCCGFLFLLFIWFYDNCYATV
jgi:hypothetical protein